MILRPLSKRSQTILRWTLSPLWLSLVALLHIDHWVRWVCARIGRHFWSDRENWTPYFAWWPVDCEDYETGEWPQMVWLERIERRERRRYGYGPAATEFRRRK